MVALGTGIRTVTFVPDLGTGKRIFLRLYLKTKTIQERGLRFSGSITFQPHTHSQRPERDYISEFYQQNDVGNRNVIDGLMESGDYHMTRREL